MSAIAAVLGGAGAPGLVSQLLGVGEGAPSYVFATETAALAAQAAVGVSATAGFGAGAAVHGRIYRRAALWPLVSHRWRAHLEARGGPSRASDAELLLGVYDGRGANALAAVDGDFAFVLWDDVAGRLLCGRDLVGLHALHVARCDGALLVATRARDIRAWPAWQQRLDAAAIGATIAGLFNVDPGTGIAGIRALAPGELLVVERDGRRTSRTLWTLPEPDAVVRRLGFDDAAAELRRRLGSAVVERMAPEGNTGVWLSGGWDSSAVFAAGLRALADRGDGRDLVPLSMSYPEGDPGREDELIADVVSAHGRAPRWCLIGDTPLLAEPPRAGRDGAFAHAFEEWNRAMARATRAVPSRVALVGAGGDELFAGTTIYLSDLLRGGRLLALAHDWYRERGRTLHRFPELVLRPAATRLADGFSITTSWRRWNEASIPSWVRADFVRAHALADRERAAAPRSRRDLADLEMTWLLEAPHFARVRGALAEAVGEEGVLLRAPLLDREVIAFARARPRAERVSGGQTKRLLRHAMRGLLPDPFLAPRTHRTGVTSGYLVRGLSEGGRAAVDATFAAPVLAELGIVDPVALRREWERFRVSGRSMDALALFQTYAVEHWTRQQLGAAMSELFVPHAASSLHPMPFGASNRLAATPAAGPAGRSAQTPHSPEGW